MKKTFVIILLVLMICAALVSCGLVKSPDKYELGDKDSVSSITKVVGERTVKTTRTSSQYVKYVYKNIADTVADVEKYAAYLVNNEGFTASKKYKNIDPAGEIKFTKTSESDSAYLIVVTVTYTESEYTVEAERQNKVL